MNQQDFHYDWLSGGGRMGDLIRSHDWSATPVGPPAEWPQPLRTLLTIMLNANQPMFTAWGPEQIIFYNDQYSKILGRKHPTALGRPFFEVWHELVDVLEPIMDRAYAGEPTHMDDIDLVMRRHGYPEETHFSFSYTPIRDETGKVGGVFCPCDEITGLILSTRRTSALRRLTARLTGTSTTREVFTRATQLLSDYRRDLPFVLFYSIEGDPPVARLESAAGLEPGSAAGPGQMTVSPEAPAQWPVASVLRTGSAIRITDLMERFGPLDCGPYPEPPTSAMALPIISPVRPGPLGVVIAGVSARLRLDESYRNFYALLANAVSSALTNALAFEQEKKRAEALAEIDRAKTLFFSNVSHEFRTPLTLMLGPTEDALRSPEAALAGEDLEAVHRNALRLLKLVNTLLDFSRIEAKRIEASYLPTDLSQMTAHLASVFRSAVEKAELSLVVDCPPLGEPVYVDREMWEKIVLNLLSNAFKFTFEGEIAVSLHRSGSAAVLSVRDTGTGIPASETNHLFERFYRIKDARARSHEGSGIGLALVQELVNLHGGTIGVSSRMGQGSTFRVAIPLGKDHLPADRIGAPRRLPPTSVGAIPFVEEALRWLPAEPPPPGAAAVEPDAAPAHRLPDDEESRGTETARVLLVDDNADMRRYLLQLLTPHWRALAVADGAAALNAILADPPDLVLADVMMPGMDGFELLQRLRSAPDTRNIPVILLSARAGEEARIEGMGAGADDYLIKPFSAQELTARVRAHLKLARLRRKTREALKENERLHRTVIQNLPGSAIYLFDEEMRFILAEGQALGPIGFNKDALEGKRISDLDDETRAILEPRYRRVLAGESQQYETRFRGRVFHSHYLPVRQGDGEIRMGLVAARDITERKRMEEKLRRLNENLEQQVAERTQLAEARSRQLQSLAVELIEAEEGERRRIADLLHDDLQQLLASVKLQLQTASRDLPENRVLGNVSQLLEIAIEKTRNLSHELSPSMLHHSGLVPALQWLVRKAKEQFGLTVELETAADRDFSSVPLKEFLFRVVQELLFNAFKHAGVTTARVHLSGTDDRIIVTVSDGGKGFDPAILHSPTARSGLGLLSIRERVHSLGGDLHIESAPGSGSRFTLTVPFDLPVLDDPTPPLAAENRAAPAPTGPAPYEAQKTIRVLFADDHQVMRQGLISMIEDQPSIEVVGEATDGLEALELTRQLRPDLVVMDITMPEMDGLEATHHITREMPEVRVVGLSMYEEEEIRRAMRDAGAESFVSKTASPGDLLKAIYGMDRTDP